MHNIKRYKWIGLIVVLVLIQLFRVDTKNPISGAENDFIISTNTPPAAADLIKTSCYDCHSNQTKYPWYFQVAPVSWWLKHHINEGREELNFSEWTTYSSKRKDHKLKEAIEQISKGEMPMSSYTSIHKEAALSKEQQGVLKDWFTSLRTFESKKN